MTDCVELATLQSDRSASHLGLFVLRPDRDRLLVALRDQVQGGAKRLTFRHDLKAGAFDLAGQRPGCIAGRLAPVPADRIA